ncbi:MAG: ATP phosphoribosyltransferase [Candidatus Nanopelagicales bacterium]|nr:ATP phosphoribosyltransferase [Candidatus Nanopelagicales bacterium]
MLRVALPNKGQLAEPAKAVIAEAGYSVARGPRELVVTDEQNNVEFFLLRPRDIATYVGTGTLDLGITGRDMLRDSGAPVDERLALGFAPSTFRLAAPVGRVGQIGDFSGFRIATSYPRVLADFLSLEGIEASVVHLDGAVENAVALGVADAIADVVDTGSTLRAAGLETVGEPILRSEALLVGRTGATLSPDAEVFVRRLQGVLTARAYVLVDYDIPLDRVEVACELTPGLESPTVSPLREQGWAAVRAVVLKRDVHQVMDRLADLGGRGILVTKITACRL